MSEAAKKNSDKYGEYKDAMIVRGYGSSSGCSEKVGQCS